MICGTLSTTMTIVRLKLIPRLRPPIELKNAFGRVLLRDASIRERKTTIQKVAMIRQLSRKKRPSTLRLSPLLRAKKGQPLLIWQSKKKTRSPLMKKSLLIQIRSSEKNQAMTTTTRLMTTIVRMNRRRLPMPGENGDVDNAYFSRIRPVQPIGRQTGRTNDDCHCHTRLSAMSVRGNYDKGYNIS
jgi:hypothetical protein